MGNWPPWYGEQQILIDHFLESIEQFTEYLREERDTNTFQAREERENYLHIAREFVIALIRIRKEYPSSLRQSLRPHLTNILITCVASVIDDLDDHVDVLRVCYIFAELHTQLIELLHADFAEIGV